MLFRSHSVIVEPQFVGIEMAKRKTAMALKSPHELKVERNLNQGIGSLIKPIISKKSKAELETQTIKLYQVYGESLERSYALTDQLNEQNAQRTAANEARRRGKQKKFKPAKVAVTQVHWQLKNRLRRNPTLKKELIPELTRQFPDLFKNTPSSTIHDWLTELNQGKNILDGS